MPVSQQDNFILLLAFVIHNRASLFAILMFAHAYYVKESKNYSLLLIILSVIDDTTKEIVYRDYVDISVAVATPKVRNLQC